jgi:hypothetical protein
MGEVYIAIDAIRDSVLWRDQTLTSGVAIGLVGVIE